MVRIQRSGYLGTSQFRQSDSPMYAGGGFRGGVFSVLSPHLRAGVPNRTGIRAGSFGPDRGAEGQARSFAGGILQPRNETTRLEVELPPCEDTACGRFEARQALY